MPSPVDREPWIIVPTFNMASNTDSHAQHEVRYEATSPEIEAGLDTKLGNCALQTDTTTHLKPNHGSSTASGKKDPACTCPVHPTPQAKDTDEWYSTEDDQVPRSRPRRRAAGRRYSPSPVALRAIAKPEQFTIPAVTSSTKLLSHVNAYDGIVDLPWPARSSIYLTTYPFTNNSVKKFGWLFAHATEDTFISPNKGPHADYDDFAAYPPPVIHNRRGRDPYNDLPVDVDMPKVLLSRALDPGVVPERTDGKSIQFLIVVQHRFKFQGLKLLIAESTREAGILIYYEALSGHSVVFVGAILEERKKGLDVKFKRVETLEEAAGLSEQKEGIVGVVC